MINLEKDVNKKKEAIYMFMKFEKAISKLIRSNKDYEFKKMKKLKSKI